MGAEGEWQVYLPDVALTYRSLGGSKEAQWATVFRRSILFFSIYFPFFFGGGGGVAGFPVGLERLVAPFEVRTVLPSWSLPLGLEIILSFDIVICPSCEVVAVALPVSTSIDF